MTFHACEHSGHELRLRDMQKRTSRYPNGGARRGMKIRVLEALSGPVRTVG